jgi:isoquinoline 1-oxidoreductase subunit beta
MKKMSAGKVPSGLLEDDSRQSKRAWVRGQIGRREFLKTSSAASAGLVIAFYLPARGEGAGGKEFEPNAWLQIDPQGDVSLWVARSEMGQGVRTSMTMLIAEELDADWSRIRVVQADTDAKYGDMVTGGSASVRNSWEPLRKAGATGRELLLTAAAKTWGVPKSQCVAQNSTVLHKASGKKLSYGELAEKAAALPAPKDVALKDPKDFQIIGHPEARVDGPRIVVGEAKYGIDAKVAGMRYAVIARCPVLGGRVKRFDATKAKAVPGVRDVVEIQPIEMPTLFGFQPGKPGHQHFLSSGVAVVADSTWQAMQGRKVLEIDWDEGPHASESSAGYRTACADMAGRPGKESAKAGDPEAAFAKAATKLEAVYEVPFLAHAAMEPMNCTAAFQDGKCELWAPTQNSQGVLAAVASALKVPTSAVTIHITLLGGGFGRRLNVDYGVEAALISKAAGAPVKVFWTREDDIRHDYYRPLSYQRFRAGLDTRKNLTAFLHHVVAPSTDSTYEGPETPDLGGTELSGPGMPAGTVPNYLIEYSFLETGVPRGYWRAVDPNTNQFPLQSFVDEIAAAMGKDPLELRRQLIGPARPPVGEAKEGEDKPFDNRRLRRVLDMAAERAGWGKPLGARRGRGIAGQYSFGTHCAEVAEVTVGKDGTLKVDRVVCVVDCGQVVNPDMVVAQIEGGIGFGLAAALFGEITVENGRIKQGNFNDYPVLRIGDMPPVEVHIVPSKEDPGGIGEPGVPSIAPAVGNAIFAATGKRLRRLPFQTRELAET